MTRRQLHLAACLLAVMASFRAAAADLPAAEPNGFSARADKAEVRLGAPFGYVIEIRHDPRETYELPPAFQLEPFDVSGARCRREAKGQEAVTTCTMQLALFELGEHEIPEVALLAHTPGGDRVLRVPGARIAGSGVLDPEAQAQDLQLRDIAPPAPLMVRSYRLVAWVTGVLAAVGLLVAGILYLRRRRRSRPENLPALLPHERFQRQLDALAAEELPRSGRGREYFFRLSEMIREYVGALHGLNALDLTTEEILAALARSELRGFDRGGLAAFCRQSDFVKFARHEATESECAEALTYARDLLEKTRPLPDTQGVNGAPIGPKAA